MIKRMKVTPTFNTTEIINTTLQKDWFKFQSHAFDTGKTLLRYMQSFINANHKRSGAKGILARAMNFYDLGTFGKAKVEWGIGYIPTLNQKAKYWYVVNYGKKATGESFIPGGGKYRPIYFTDGPAAASKRGAGTARVTRLAKITTDRPGPRPSVIRPMHYIEATYRMLIIHTQRLVARLKGVNYGNNL